MHASASPFEALAERLNWMGAKLEDDDFGKAMLSSGIPKETIMAWTEDPQAGATPIVAPLVMRSRDARERCLRF